MGTAGSTGRKDEATGPEPGRGTYVLSLLARTPKTLAVGALGPVTVARGDYLYVGSALGPGGLQARVGRHVVGAETPHWHIDYLLRALALREIWYASDGRRWECQWASGLDALSRSEVPVPGFGSGDCGCPSHLFRLPEPPSVETFRRRVAHRRPRRPVVHRSAPVRFAE